MIKVLVVDDSLSTQFILSHILNAQPDIRVIGTAADGRAALEAIAREKPDIITMDFHMPGMDGLEATRYIMETSPLPIVICSASWDDANTEIAFQFMEAGALAALEKPATPKHPDFARLSSQLVDAVRMLSEIRVVKRRRNTFGIKKPAEAEPAQQQPGHSQDAIASSLAAAKPGQKRLIAIAASTGGPPAIKTILQDLPADFALPILMVQHITEGFLPGLIDWLAKLTQLKIKQGVHSELPLPGHVYLAPAAYQMGIDRSGRIFLSDSPKEHSVRPSASYLFRSLAQHAGASSVGVLLTGMGVDGALELKSMRDAGALTIAQNQETSAIFGMPGEAIKLGGAALVLSPEQIRDTLISIAQEAAIARTK